MAAIVNDRDVLLQAASARLLNMPLPSNIFIPGLSGINLTSSSSFIKLDVNQNPTPTLIEITAHLAQVSGTIVWEIIAGSGNLFGGDNDTKFIDNANMFTDSVTIRATIVHNSITYQSLLTIQKVRDGANGTPGTPGSNGLRGSVNVYMYVGAPGWSDAVADAALVSFTGGNQKVVGDTATLLYSNTWSELRYWNGFGWVQPGTVINGNLLVTQSIAGDKIAANQIAAWHMQANSITAANGALGDLTVTSAKVAQEIASDQYYATGGSQGWAINRNGNAAFLNIYARGDIHASSIVANSITTGHLQVNSVNTDRIFPGSVTTQAFGAVAGPVTLPFTWTGPSVSAVMECHDSPGLIQVSQAFNQGGAGPLLMRLLRNGNIVYEGAPKPFFFGNLGGGTTTWTVSYRQTDLGVGSNGNVSDMVIAVVEYRR